MAAVPIFPVTELLRLRTGGVRELAYTDRHRRILPAWRSMFAPWYPPPVVSILLPHPSPLVPVLGIPLARHLRRRTTTVGERWLARFFLSLAPADGDRLLSALFVCAPF